MIRRLLVIAVALVLLSAQGGERPEPPPGWFCSPTGDGDHRCTCHRVDYDRACEGQPTHDQVCKVFCHENHCSCPVTCQPIG